MARGLANRHGGTARDLFLSRMSMFDGSYDSDSALRRLHMTDRWA